MKGLHFVLIFTAMTFVSWGTYGPVLRHGTHALDKDSLRAFVGVGLAYFLIAVIFPLLMLSKSKESGSWTVSGVIYSLIAGSVGALGALGIILALGNGGDTVYVMPIVFGFAPVVNTLVTAYLGKTFSQIRPVFIGGIVTAALGAVGVLVFHSQGAPKPATQPEVKPAVWSVELSAVQQEGTPATSPPQPTSPSQEPAATATPTTTTQELQQPAATESNKEAKPADAKPDDTKPAEPKPAEQPSATPPTPTAQEPAKSEPAKSETAPAESSKQDDTKAPADNSAKNAEVKESSAAKPASSTEKDKMAIALSIIMAAICWGSYGPMLHIGQSKMSGSRLRPFMCVGIAYFLIAVFVPLVLIFNRSVDNGSWTPVGMTWAFFAGVAGALGALGVILAFNAGGKPIYVMPLVFGFAPVINTSITLSEKNAWGEVHPMFWVSLAVVIAGAVTVLITAPKPKPKPAH